MHTHSIISELLSYPQRKIGELEHYMNIFAFENIDCTEFVEFCKWYEACELQELQEDYVATFDISKTISLNLFEYAYGSSPRRGPAMAELVDIYVSAGFILADEMPDYLPALLEFAAEAGTEYISPMMPVISGALQTLTSKLEEAGSKYAVLTGIAALILSENSIGCSESLGGI